MFWSATVGILTDLFIFPTRHQIPALISTQLEPFILRPSWHPSHKKTRFTDESSEMITDNYKWSLERSQSGLIVKDVIISQESFHNKNPWVITIISHHHHQPSPSSAITIISHHHHQPSPSAILSNNSSIPTLNLCVGVDQLVSSILKHIGALK